MRATLPTRCEDVVRAYLRLDFGEGRLVACPYFQNRPPRRRFGVTAEVGKGSPAEIIAETYQRAAMHWKMMKTATASAIREFMVQEKIGVDCSGFATHVLEPLIRERTGLPLGTALKPNSESQWKRLFFRMRPFQNADVMTLTNTKNCMTVKLMDVLPGDLVRSRGGKHVLLISQTERDGRGMLQAFNYIHSSEAFGNESGVREGSVNIVDPGAPLEHQEWREVWQGRRPTLEGWLEQKERNGIFRLKILS